MKTSSDNLRGVGFLTLAMLVFSLQDVAVKFIGGDYPIMQIVILRSFVALPLTVLLYRLEGGRGLPSTQRLFPEILRGLFLFLSYTTYFMALASLPLADIAAIRFSGPLMITVLSVLLLGERVAGRHWLALLIGFGGVLIVVQPGGSSFNLGSVFVLLATLFYALSVIITRQLRADDRSATMAYFSTLVYMVAAALLAPVILLVGELPEAHSSVAFLFRAWTVPSVLDALVMGGLGLIWAGGMVLIARAYSLALASVAAPFEYVTLPIGILWDVALWREVPGVMTLAGALVALASGLYILYQGREGDTARSNSG